jgi:hypothetical protein
VRHRPLFCLYLALYCIASLNNAHAAQHVVRFRRCIMRSVAFDCQLYLVWACWLMCTLCWISFNNICMYIAMHVTLFNRSIKKGFSCLLYNILLSNIFLKINNIKINTLSLLIIVVNSYYHIHLTVIIQD